MFLSKTHSGIHRERKRGVRELGEGGEKKRKEADRERERGRKRQRERRGRKICVPTLHSVSNCVTELPHCHCDCIDRYKLL